MENTINLEKQSPLESDQELNDNIARLAELRKDGSAKIAALKEELFDIKRQKLIDEFSRNKIITQDEEALKQAREVKNQYRNEEREIIDASLKKIKEISIPYEKEQARLGKEYVQNDSSVHELNVDMIKTNAQIALANKKVELVDKREKFLTEHAEQKNSNDPIVRKQYKKDLARFNKECKDEITSIKIARDSQLVDEKNRRDSVKEHKKQMKYDAYQARYNAINVIKEGHVGIIDNFEHKFQNYIYKFNIKTFFLNNALYIVVILFFLGCFILAPLTGKGNIFTWANISGLLEVASSRIFFALGVAGLIVLGGTDLSVGRIIGLGTVVVGFLLQDGAVPAKLFGHSVNLDSWSFPLRMTLAIILPIVATTLFTSTAGFFSAKFKMHPFITTLSTMMIMYGLGMVATAGAPTGTPSTHNLKSIILGRIGGGAGFPKYIIYAVIAIAIVWFIWNKTKFGKNMFAVGGNAEAAAVSGISYFKVTFGVFVMAGILYGIGSFFFSFQTNPSTNTGYGYELDAIAACVVGGISFFGGIGKVKGAVIGCLIFAGLTYILDLLGVSSYYQFIVKGIILMAAVALDSLKYIKKK